MAVGSIKPSGAGAGEFKSRLQSSHLISSYRTQREGQQIVVETASPRLNCHSLPSVAKQSKDPAKMCYPVKCGTCSKTTWAGCGKHVPSVYDNVPKGQACMCKGWPGVNLPKQENCTDASSTTKTAAATATQTTSITK